MTIKPIPGFTAEMRDACAKEATSFLSGDPKNGIPLRSPTPHEIAAAIRAMPIVPPFPEPMREAPEPKSIYWLAMPHASGFSMETEWRGNKSDLLWLSRGLCHATREAAESHGRYLASLSAKTDGGHD